MKHHFNFRLLFGSLALLLATPAQAHMSDYLVSREYYTASKGEIEIELFSDWNLTDLDHDDTWSTKHKVELEYGVTSHWQVALVDQFKWNRTDNWEQDSWKLESQYRFFEVDELPVDIAIFGEYINPNGSRDNRSDKLEGKLILSKNIGQDWNVVGNIITERKVNEADDWELAYTLGLMYRYSPKVRFGLELKETLGDTSEFGIHRKDHVVQLVPGIYWHPKKNVSILFGPAIGLTHAADDLQLKSLVEIEF